MSGAFVSYVRPGKNGILIYRRRFPQELVPYIPLASRSGMGRKEFCVSLLAKSLDDPVAAQRWQATKAEYDRIVTEARHAEATALKRSAGKYDTLLPTEIAFLAEAFRQEALADDDAARWDPTERDLYAGVVAQLASLGVQAVTPWEGREGSRWATKAREAAHATLQGAKALRANADLAAIVEYWRDDAIELAEAHGFVLDPADTKTLIAFCRALNDAAISASKDIVTRSEGEEYPETPPEPLRPLEKASAPTVSLLGLFDGYADAQGITPSVRKEWRRYMEIFVEFLGHADAAQISRDDVVRWRDHLLVEKDTTGALRRKPVTVRDKYMTSLKCTLGWALEERLLGENVAVDVIVRVPRATKLRDPNYTMDEAKQVLRASLVPAGPHLSAPSARARRWLPWLCAYSGVRVGELAQLRTEDVQLVDGVWTLRVTPEAGSVKTKKARQIPIHEHIIAQGFLAEIKALPKGPVFYDPANRRASNDAEENRHVKKVGERLASWVRNTVGIIDPEVKPNHAWRHLFSTLAEEAGIAERTYMAIQGHAANNVARKYGSTTLKTKAEAIARFPRFDI